MIKAGEIVTHKRGDWGATVRVVKDVYEMMPNHYVAFFEGGGFWSIADLVLASDFEPLVDGASADIDKGIVRDALRAIVSAPSKNNIVYIIRPAHTGFVKIGYAESLGSFRNRIECFTCMNPMEPEVMAVFRGSLKLERHLHRCFQAQSLRREWFRLDATLMEFVRRAKQLEMGSQFFSQF